MRGDQCINDLVHISARKIVGLKLINAHIQSRLICLDERQNNATGRHTAQAHTDERYDAHRDIGRDRGHPQAKGHKVQKDGHSQNNDDNEECSSKQCSHTNLLNYLRESLLCLAHNDSAAVHGQDNNLLSLLNEGAL